MGKTFRVREVSCEFCKDGVKEIDYKNVEVLLKYVSRKGKILPRRTTGTCAFHQRKLSKAIKRARMIALLPYSESYYLS
ncbi:MAG TPA: 30S ribosomal protein S18 [Candidatus Hydrothermia bacterium]|nr:30S ribosomal protein S18 [Candidatus Hydrothermae bacterium]MDD3648723.1 30S ribosomal protein S18 [Candidatus Hydrothermia bacterium]MDD5573251.1 30S ribosomal protein S18 [Candidatus Hydrothermia bacterium]HOK22417.1 30S ribosomal protein S18 [Candidatus Hydrothermia bacterium]HOL23124.1 30S ribosomal protein S18 [Candidatus Hydrothermia bacterium]